MNLKHRSGGFTLLELILSMVILTILAALIMNLASMAGATTSSARLRLEADDQARAVFDRMSQDFSGMLKRKDIDAVFSKHAGNDKLFFYSQTPAYFSRDPVNSKRGPLALIGYRINSTFQLERLGKGLEWDDDFAAASLNFLTYPSGNPRSRPLEESTIAGRWKQTLGVAPEYDGTDRDYHVVGDHIGRLEICFQLKASETPVDTYSVNPFYPGHSDVVGPGELSAIIVTIAVFDPTNQPSDAQKEALSRALSDPSDSDLHASPPILAAALWQRELRSANFASKAGISQSTASHVRIYERIFNLNNP